jgi:transcriptional regulator with XRE-family HTH domain
VNVDRERPEAHSPVGRLRTVSRGPRLTAETGGPIALRIMLGAELRRLREARGISREDAGAAIRGSASKISRMELGRVGFKERDVIDLAALYGLRSPDRVRELLSLMQQANTPGWWSQYGDVVPDWFQPYIGLEQAAVLIRTFSGQVVPELLQTEEYATAHLQLTNPEETGAVINRMVELRMGRQKILERETPPHVWAIVDEAAFRRGLGGPQVMRRQIERLAQLAGLPWLTLQIMPFRAGAHPGTGGPFTILRFADRDLSDIVYLEQFTSALYLDKDEDLERYMAVMDRLCVQAEHPGATEALLTHLGERI